MDTKQIKDLCQKFNDGLISYSTFKQECMNIFANANMMHLRGVAEDSARIIQDLSRVEEEYNLNIEKEIPMARPKITKANKTNPAE